MRSNSSSALDSNSAWNGSPTFINTSQGLFVPQTPNGTTIFTALNECTSNNAGGLAVRSGPMGQFYDVPALAGVPTILMQNWQANDFAVTNISTDSNTPILCQLIGPGMPGVSPIPLPVGSPIQLAAGQVAQGTGQPWPILLTIQSTVPGLGVLGLIGGPVTNGNNGYIFAINCSTDEPAPGYTMMTTGNTFAYQFNWGSSTVFIGNMSPSRGQILTVTLLSL